MTGTQPCQVVEETDRSPPEQLECSLEKCQQVYQQPIEGAREFVNNKHMVVFFFFFYMQLIFKSLQSFLVSPLVCVCVCAERLCSNCAKGWLKFENTCYFLSQNRLTWQKSREECQRKGGDLAVITNERVQVSKSRIMVK